MWRAQPPRRVFVLLALFFVGGLTALAGIIFYTRTPTATVLIHIDVDLGDQTLSFFLDGKQVPAEKLQAPMELKVGTHELLVKRGEEVIRKFTFVVSRDAGPRIELREEITLKKKEVQPKHNPLPKQDTAEDEDRRLAEWLLSIGAGRVTVSVDGQPLQHIIKTRGDTLPAGALRVHHFDIWGNKQVNDDTVEPILKWIERRNVATEFGFYGTNIKDETVRRLTALPCVKNISVGGTRVTRACIPHLAKRPDLEELYLSSVPITDDDLAQLAGLTQLKALNIAGSQITDAGMKHLKGMRALRDLGIDSTMLSGACLDDLAALPIQYLNLNKTKVRGRDALSKLSKLTELKDVRLEGLLITDDDLNGLIECRSVEKIWLRDNRITDKGLEILAQMKWLRELGLAYHNPETAITPAGIERLRKALPNCNIVYEPAKGGSNQ